MCGRVFNRILQYSVRMGKTITIKVPDWLDERLVVEAVKRLVEAEEARRKLVEEIIGQLSLDERSLEDFERFREELWRKEREKYLS